jgi:hypothetical protein
VAITAEQARTLNLEALEAGDACEVAKASWRQASRFKMLFTTLVFLLGVATLIALIYALVSFRDDQSARGWLGLVSAVVTGAGATLLIKLRGDAADDEAAMFRRVQRVC